MDISMKFSDVHGENVTLTREKNSASWKHLYSGGLLFSQLPLTIGNPVKLYVRGTSIVHVGFYTGDPADITNVKDLYLNKKVDLIAQLNVYNKKCSAHLERKASNFTYKLAGIPYRIHIAPGTDIWIAVYIQIGDASVKLCSKMDLKQLMPFHTKHGSNIEFTDKTRTTAKLQIHNPAATSCIELNPTEEKAVSVTLRLKPSSPEIKRYGLSLLASSSNSNLLRSSHEFMFTTGSKIQKHQKYTLIHSFKRTSGKLNTCDGELKIKVEHGGKVKYYHDSAGTGSAHVTEQLPQSGGITLILDMCQVSVDIIDACEYDVRFGSDEEEECSSLSSANSTSVVSTALYPSRYSPTSPSVLPRKQTADGIHEDSRSQDKIDCHNMSFKQPHNDSKRLPAAPKDKERLNDWIQETTKYNLPKSPLEIPFTLMEDKSGVNDKEITASETPRKRANSVHSGEFYIQRKYARTHSYARAPSPSSLFPLRQSSTWHHDQTRRVSGTFASGETKEVVYIAPRLEEELLPIQSRGISYLYAAQTEAATKSETQQTQGLRTKQTSPTNSRLEQKRSQMGIRIGKPTHPSTDVHSDDGTTLIKRTDRTMKHQMTYPNLSAAIDNSDLFRDDYSIDLQEKATTKHYLKDKIQQNYTNLVEKLTVIPLMDHLFEADILGDDELDKITSCTQNSEKNRTLLAILRKKPVNKGKFITALRNAKLDHLVSMFV